MNYEAIITNRGADFFGKVLSRRRTMLVLDESIQIKNPKARRTKLVLGWRKEAVMVRALSGAPVVQGPQDLWSQLTFLGADLGNFYQFRNRFCKMGGYMGKQVVGALDEIKLNILVHKFSFRAKKDDWLDLPKKIYTCRNADLTPQQAKHYKNMKDDLMTLIDKQEIGVEMMISAMLKMQQITSGFIIPGLDQPPIEIPGGNPKLALVKEVLEEVTGRVLIFVYFRYSAALLSKELAREGYRCATLLGGMTPAQTETEKRRFNEGDCTVLICQTQSAKYGHTLLGPANDRCATTIFYENSYNLDDRLQGEDRNHRIGQDKSVVYVDMVCSPIEEKVVSALQKKTGIAQAIIDGVHS